MATVYEIGELFSMVSTLVCSRPRQSGWIQVERASIMTFDGFPVYVRFQQQAQIPRMLVDKVDPTKTQASLYVRSSYTDVIGVVHALESHFAPIIKRYNPDVQLDSSVSNGDVIRMKAVLDNTRKERANLWVLTKDKKKYEGTVMDLVHGAEIIPVCRVRNVWITKTHWGIVLELSDALIYRSDVEDEATSLRHRRPVNVFDLEGYETVDCASKGFLLK
jgi:hypothetical protein